MSEKRMRQRVLDMLRPLDGRAVENKVGMGTPDVNYADGWIELKWAKHWPKRPTTPLRLPHFTRNQRLWLQRRSSKGGKVWVLLQVEQSWLLFDGRVAARSLGELNRAELHELAYRVWDRGSIERGLVECLRQEI